jgi:hypothetical protein
MTAPVHSETWEVTFEGVWVDGQLVPANLALNPWFWWGRRLGVRVATVVYFVRRFGGSDR